VSKKCLAAIGMTCAALVVLLPTAAYAGDGGTQGSVNTPGGSVTPDDAGKEKSTKSGSADPGLLGAVNAQWSCRWVEEVGFTVSLPGTTFVAPMEQTAGSGLFWRAWRDCDGGVHVLLDATPEQTAAAVYALTIARIPTPVYELYPPVEWGGIVKVPNWLYAGNNIKAFSVTGGLPGNAVTITVTPANLAVDWGDGPVESCKTLGVAYDPAKHPTLLREQAREEIPVNACAHVYKHHSGKQPNEEYPVQVTINWTAGWAAASGQRGTFNPYSETVGFGFKVDQIQTIGGSA
jgi:hypothetical protein